MYNNIGLALRVPAGDLEAIEKSNAYKVDRCFQEMLKVCLSREGGLSQRALADALCSPTVARADVGRKIRSQTFN